MLNDFLFELGTEELPSGAVWPLADALANHMVAALAKAGLSHGEVHRFATPRRLALFIQDVQSLQPAQSISRRGPAVAAAEDPEGKPTPALLGFAKSCGVGLTELTKSKTDKGEWWVYEATKPGAAAHDLLAGMVNESISQLPIPKPMRWGSGDVQFARPVHWAVLLWGNDVIDAHVLGVRTGRQSIGHRFHHPQRIDIPNPVAYEACMKDAFVIADFSLRRQLIVDQVKQLAASEGCVAEMPDALVDEVTSIVEWPIALMAHFEQAFLEVPAEALIAAMQSHQKCFALRDPQGNLRPDFITVANIDSNIPLQVVKGNEKVMRARLSDAAFFYDQDKRKQLNAYYDATAKVVFQAKLGSLQDKMIRLKALMDTLASSLTLDKAQAARAALLSKCDLMTGMVGEFPELQGLMGYYYALQDGEDKLVAKALDEQYMPRFSGDQLPASPLGMALSLADRLDTLVGTFAIGQKPTGVKDPFKLRRHALAVVRMLIAIPTTLRLSTLINDALHGYGEQLQVVDDVLADLKPFILERLVSFYQSQGVAQEIVQAVRARQDDCLYDLDKRLKALMVFIQLPEAASLTAACKRVNNLLQQATDPIDKQGIDTDQLEASAEKALFEQVRQIEHSLAPLYSSGDYVSVLNQLAGLKDGVDAFFDQVMVMVDNPAIKANRLSLLARLQDVLQGVADISLL